MCDAVIGHFELSHTAYLLQIRESCDKIHRLGCVSLSKRFGHVDEAFVAGARIRKECVISAADHDKPRAMLEAVMMGA